MLIRNRINRPSSKNIEEIFNEEILDDETKDVSLNINV